MRILALTTILLGCGRSDLADDERFADATSSIDGSNATDGSSIHDGALDAGDAADAGPTCGPTNCKTCCQPDGKCAFTGSDSTCGNGGQACKVCPPGYHCSKNPYCVKVVAECNPSTCDGCCTDPKLGLPSCVSGTDNFVCGTGGIRCQDCGSIKGASCVPTAMGIGGSCQTKPQACSPSTCAGCCYGPVCAVGVQDLACGANGQACVDCTATSQTCTNHACK